VRRSGPPRRLISGAYISSVLRRFNIFIPTINDSHCPDGPLVLSSGSMGLCMKDKIVGIIPPERSSGQHHRWLLTITWVHSKNNAISFHCAPDLVSKSYKNLIMKSVCTRWGLSGESMEHTSRVPSSAVVGFLGPQGSLL